MGIPAIRKQSVFGCVGMSLAMFGDAAGAQEVSSKQILDAIAPPKAATYRNFTLGPQTPPPARSADDVFLDGLRNRTSQTVSVSDREKLSALLPTKPQIDLPMEFERNSAALRGKALQNADNLGKALSNEVMKGQIIVIAGHTDAKGSDKLNQELSERRAEAVKQLLIKHYGIAASNLIAVGYGKTHLKNTSDPLAGENRRVQTVNMTNVSTAAVNGPR